MIDLLFLTHNRREFTEASLAALIANTNWKQVRRLIIYDDASKDGTREYLTTVDYPGVTEFRFGHLGGPVATMNDYLRKRYDCQEDLFAKIDSDTIVPAGWLEVCLNVMAEHPELDLLGIESFTPVSADPNIARGYDIASFIGGIGLMRTACFRTLPVPNGRFGFTKWQDDHPEVSKGWLNPSLPVCLLDRLPIEPWRSLSQQYVAKGWQRDWGPYDSTSSGLWAWWIK